jgi:hypothetical protein
MIFLSKKAQCEPIISRYMKHFRETNDVEKLLGKNGFFINGY